MSVKATMTVSIAPRLDLARELVEAQHGGDPSASG